MNKPATHHAEKAVDSVQQQLTAYACALEYASLPPEVVHGAKVRIINTLAAAIVGFFSDPSRAARKLAADMPDPDGATIMGTRMKTTPDMAAFVNTTSTRHSGVTDSYHWPGSSHGHASDTVTPLLGVAEQVNAGGRELIASVVLAYEVFLRFCDVYESDGFYTTPFAGLGSAVAAGKLFRLTPEQMSHAISMMIVPNNVLKQVIMGQKTMFRAANSGMSCRAGVFAAMLARAGMEGPHLPFEGKAGWCEHIARKRISLGAMGGKGTPFKILHTSVKRRVCDGDLTAMVLAGEKISPLNISQVQKVVAEVYGFAKDRTGTEEVAWMPETRENADHSAPFLLAVTLRDGSVSQRSYTDANYHSPELRALMRKIEVVENKEYTQAFERQPVEHHSRVTVVTNSGERLVGKAGGGADDLGAGITDAQLNEKFRELTEDYLGAKRVTAILDTLWHLEDLTTVAGLPALFILD